MSPVSTGRVGTHDSSDSRADARDGKLRMAGRLRRPVLAKPPSHFVFPILAAGGIYQALLQAAIVPLLPSLPAYTGASHAAVSWLLTGSLLAGAVTTPIFGRLADMFGKKRIIVVSLMFMTVGSLMCALTSDIVILIAARVLQGAGAAVVPVGISILREELPKDQVLRALGLLTATFGIGTLVGLPLAAGIAEFADWHILFWLMAGVGALTGFAAAWFIRESRSRTGGHFDGLGAFGLTVVLVTLLLPVTQGSSWGWMNPIVLALFTTSAVVFVLWVVQQRHNRNPLVNVGASTRRSVLVPHLAALLVGIAFYGNILITTQLLQASDGDGYGLTMLQATLCQLPNNAAMMLLATVAAWMSTRSGPKATLLTGSAFLFGGYIVHAVPDKPLWALVVALGVTGIGTTFVYCALPVLILGVVPLREAAATNGVNVLLRTIGTTLCSAVVATILASRMGAGGSMAGAAMTAYIFCGGCAAVSFTAALALPSQPSPDVSGRTSA
jgi:MFS family permease